MENFKNHYENNHIFNYILFILVLYRRYINVCICVPPPPPPHFLASSYATDIYIYICADQTIQRNNITISAGIPPPPPLMLTFGVWVRFRINIGMVVGLGCSSFDQYSGGGRAQIFFYLYQVVFCT